MKLSLLVHKFRPRNLKHLKSENVHHIVHTPKTIPFLKGTETSPSSRPDQLSEQKLSQGEDQEPTNLKASNKEPGQSDPNGSDSDSSNELEDPCESDRDCDHDSDSHSSSDGKDSAESDSDTDDSSESDSDTDDSSESDSDTDDSSESDSDTDDSSESDSDTDEGVSGFAEVESAHKHDNEPGVFDPNCYSCLMHQTLHDGNSHSSSTSCTKVKSVHKNKQKQLHGTKITNLSDSDSDSDEDTSCTEGKPAHVHEEERSHYHDTINLSESDSDTDERTNYTEVLGKRSVHESIMQTKSTLGGAILLSDYSRDTTNLFSAGWTSEKSKSWGINSGWKSDTNT